MRRRAFWAGSVYSLSLWERAGVRGLRSLDWVVIDEVNE